MLHNPTGKLSSSRGIAVALRIHDMIRPSIPMALGFQFILSHFAVASTTTMEMTTTTTKVVTTTVLVVVLAMEAIMEMKRPLQS